MRNKIVVRCPYHKEKTGSMILDLKANRFECLGCGKKGTIRQEVFVCADEGDWLEVDLSGE